MGCCFVYVAWKPKKRHTLKSLTPPWAVAFDRGGLKLSELISDAQKTLGAMQGYNWVVVSNISNFHPYLGKIPILINIFQMGWNHQLVQQLFILRPCL